MRKDFQKKINGIVTSIIKEEQQTTPDGKRFMDKVGGLKQTLDPVMKSISNAQELEEVIGYMIQNMPQIDTVEMKTAFSKLISKMGTPTSSSAPKDDMGYAKMNETFSRIKKSIIK